MTSFSRFLLEIARWIAGSERREWIDAMEAEAVSLEGRSTAWAMGCLWASMKDRVKREWRFLAAILLLPVCVLGLQFLLFFPILDLSHFAGLPEWTFIAVFLLLPLPFAFVLGRLRPGIGAYLAAVISFLIVHAFPIVTFWIQFGKSPLDWFGDKAHWYNMTPVAGLGCSLFVWLAGVWLGSRSKRAAAN